MSTGSPECPGDEHERLIVSKQAVVSTPVPKSAKQSVTSKTSPSDSSSSDKQNTGKCIASWFERLISILQ